jgi:phytol kinase
MLGGTLLGLLAPLFTSFTELLLGVVFFLSFLGFFLFFSKMVYLTELFTLNRNSDETSLAFTLNIFLTLGIFLGILFIFHNELIIFTAGCLTVAWGDASGEIIGKRWPLVRYQIIEEKTISGSIGVLISTALSLMITCLYYQKVSILVSRIWIILIAALCCSIIEALSWKWLDNLFLPITGSLFMLWLIST